MGRLTPFEEFLKTHLLRSPTFHNVVRSIHKRFHELRYGKDPSDLEGTKVDQPGGLNRNLFFKYYVEELRNQLKGKR